MCQVQILSICFQIFGHPARISHTILRSVVQRGWIVAIKNLVASRGVVIGSRHLVGIMITVRQEKTDKSLHDRNGTR